MFNKWLFPLFFTPVFLLSTEQDWSVNKTISLEGEILYLQRDQTHNKPLITQGQQNSFEEWVPPPVELWDMHDAVKGLGFSPALKVTARILGKSSAGEASYTFMNQWKSSTIKTSPASLYFSIGEWKLFHDFSLADQAYVKCSLYFEDAQLNGLHYIPRRVARPFSAYWLFGARYLFVREKLNNVFTRGSDTSNYKIDAYNQIYVFQGGFGLVWNPSKVWGWDAVGKVGTGADIARQKTFFGDYNNQVILRDFKRKTISWPLLVDLSIRLNFNLRSLLTFFAGYQMIYLNGIALSADQLVYTAQYEPSIQATGELIISGVFGGVNISF